MLQHDVGGVQPLLSRCVCTSAWMIRCTVVLSWKASRPPSCCIRRTRKLWRVFWGRWVSSMSSRRAWCQSRLNSSCSRASSSVRLNISLRRWTPEDGLHQARLGQDQVVHAVHGSYTALLVNQGERLDIRKTSAQLPSRRLAFFVRHQELGLPEALLRVSYSEHPPLPRPGAAPTILLTLSPILAPGWRGVFTNKSILVLCIPRSLLENQSQSHTIRGLPESSSQGATIAWVPSHGSTALLARIHRRTSLGTALEEARGCSSESGIMV